MAVPLSPKTRRFAAWAVFGAGLLALGGVLLLLRFTIVTDYMYHRLVKDPERIPPEGAVIVAPADGTVLYVRRVEDGMIPEVVKQGVPVPLTQHLKTDPDKRFPDGILVGIYMAGDGVHVNRVPVSGMLVEQIVFNGPHMDMSATERTVLLTQLLPGWVRLKTWLGWPPYDLEDKADFILKSARETLVLRDVRGAHVYVVRIADYAVGKILTWVRLGEQVATGQRLGMIAGGSQTDIFIEHTPGLTPQARVGQYVYGGETILATY
ncbi:MAG: phosphatidylserine decarboxylase [Deltaproteobacteria bacterium]|nr:MAG: phosphatidylserine decarboxylase [Deltaproteobacteria bacterium]